MDQNVIGSDHYPITCKIGIDIEVKVEERMPIWKFKSADWDKFKEVSETLMMEIEESVEEVEKLNNKISESLCKAAEEVIGQSKTRRRKKTVPWWNDECSEAIKLKKVRKKYVFNDFY